MTMLIVMATDNSIIMTADKRVTRTDGYGKVIKIVSDDYKKIKIIKGKYIVSFAGRTAIAEKAFKFIDEKIVSLEYDIHLFFKNAFQYGKACFENSFPNIEPTSVFFLGYIKDDTSYLKGYSSDDDYKGMPISDSIKVRAESLVVENLLFNETQNFLSTKISSRPSFYQSNENLSVLFSEAIKRMNDQMIGKTTYSVVLTSNGATELHN
ncbi:hypothetical protein [Bacillus safensis]|uniref:hypothetical protein n=1 Tax=Bacillus safensis TaxID=561879 RepID=UPI000462E6A1|nr:hypothetical protein [Bacillus safensis]